MARLRIKADKDLSELERFGFVHKKEQKNQYEHYMYLDKDENNSFPVVFCYVWCNNREINCINGIKGLVVLYDLIQADLVEKVEEGE